MKTKDRSKAGSGGVLSEGVRRTDCSTTSLTWDQLALRQDANRYRAVFDNAAYAIFTIDMNGCITAFNPAAERLLGYREDEVLGSRTDKFNTGEWLDSLPDAAGGDRYRAAFEQTLELLRRTGGAEVETVAAHKNGLQIPVLASMTLLRGIDNEEQGVLCINLDLTERKRLAALEQREQALIIHIGRGAGAKLGEQFFDELTTELALATGAHYSAVFVRQPKLKGMKARVLSHFQTSTFSGEIIDFRSAPLESVFCNGLSIHLQNARATYPDQRNLHALEIDELIAIPLSSSRGETLGALILAQRGQLPDPLLAERLLNIFAVRASSELERLQNEQTLLAYDAEKNWLYTVSDEIQSQNTVAGVAHTVVTLCSQHRTAPRVSISLYEDESQRVLDYAGPPVHAPRRASYPFPRNLFGQVAATTKSVLLIPDFLTVIKGSEFESEARERDMQACVVMTLVDGDRLLGSINFAYSDQTMLAELDENILATFSRTTALALSRALHRQTLEYQTEHDSLTGLLNRTALHREFAEWQAAGGKQTALLLLDLDRFKEVNDTLGHHIGDAMLMQIGERLRTGLNGLNATLARLGGDEFAMFLQGSSIDESNSHVAADNLLQALRRPFLVEGAHLEIGASFGVALYPEHGADSHALLRAADVAMYKAKRSGGGVAVYNPLLDFHTPERLALISDFNRALDNQELILFYQPKVEQSGHVVGFEALLRWQRPTLGLLAPDRFLSLVEMSDAIHKLTQTVLEIACRQLTVWLSAGETWSIAVNLSARNLMDERIASYIAELLQRYQIPSGLLELEITETALIQDPAHALDILKRIAVQGVKLSIDDFGTGYSSLSYLRQMPISTLKIDRSFVREMLANQQDKLIVRSIIQLAHSLELKVVAEGVETEEILLHLNSMGCDQAQGYYFTKPLPPPELTEWIARWRSTVASGHGN